MRKNTLPTRQDTGICSRSHLLSKIGETMPFQA